MSDSMILTELRDRMRRVETRITKFLESQGFDTGTKRPRWDRGVIHIPSPQTGMKDILEAIPPGWDPDAPVHVVHEGDELAWVYLPRHVG